MLFILLFALGALAVPIAWDISKHGKDNILRRSGRDLLAYPQVQVVFKFFHVAIDRVNAAVLGAVSLTILIVIVYLVLRLLGGIVSIFAG